MAKKGKSHVSKVKKVNQTTNKMKKQGKLKLQRHRPKVQKQRQPVQQPLEYSTDSDASGDDFGDMLDEEEQQYIMDRLAKQPNLLSNVPENEDAQKRSSKKRKREHQEKTPKPKHTSDSGAETDADSNSDLEEKYEAEAAERPVKKLRPLLPIKTKAGLLERSEEVEEKEESDEDDQPQEMKSKSDKKQESDESDLDSGLDDGTEDVTEPDGEAISTVQLMAARRDRLNHEKLRIGALCSSLLESPEKKLKNLFPILYLMEERLKDGSLNLDSIRKIATLSAYEVFKDILPEYQIRHQDYSNVKLKKETLTLYKYEKELLEFYKRYLQRLEKATSVLRSKKGDTRKVGDAQTQLALVSLRCMCGLLAARPHFNYAANIAQSVVPLLGARAAAARAQVTACCVQLFADDRRGDITLVIVRLINQLAKKRGDRLQPEALDCLLSLNIKDVELDAEADLKHKKKQEEKHKKRIVNLSKKEKKRAKKLKEVERELLETQAQESAAARRKQLTEVTRTVFHIYFRLLKTAPRSRLLAAALSGLAKFTHVINMEFYTDLVAILSRLLRDEGVARRERLLCARAALAVLSGAGDALNVDPATFHRFLYNAALHIHAGESSSEAWIVVEAAWQVCARARRVSAAVLQAFAKRLAGVAAQAAPHAALACLLLLHQLAQQSRAVSALFEPEAEAGAGRFEPQLESPEHCNAGAASLHELAALRRHFHPAVRRAAAALAAPAPARALPQDLANLTPMKALQQYDGSQMSFRPAVPPPPPPPPPAPAAPGARPPAAARGPHAWAQPLLRSLCEAAASGFQTQHVDFSELVRDHSKRMNGVQ